MFRLHIDFPLGEDKDKAIDRADSISHAVKEALKNLNLMGPGDMMQYRLGNDTDRQTSNYLQINENGHCSNKKTKIQF